MHNNTRQHTPWPPTLPDKCGKADAGTQRTLRPRDDPTSCGFTQPACKESPKSSPVTAGWVTIKTHTHAIQTRKVWFVESRPQGHDSQPVCKPILKCTGTENTQAVSVSVISVCLNVVKQSYCAVSLLRKQPKQGQQNKIGSFPECSCRSTGRGITNYRWIDECTVYLYSKSLLMKLISKSNKWKWAIKWQKHNNLH